MTLFDHLLCCVNRSTWRSRASFGVRMSSLCGADAKNTFVTFSCSRTSSSSARPKRLKEDMTSISTNSPTRYRMWCQLTFNLQYFLWGSTVIFASFQTAEIGMTENVGDSGLRFEIWFRRRKSQDTFILQASSGEVKAAWTSVIGKILWRQALRNRGQRAAFSTVSLSSFNYILNKTIWFFSNIFCFLLKKKKNDVYL